VITRFDAAHSPTGSGITLAVWADGAAIATTDINHPSDAMVVGRIDPAIVASVLSELDGEGFFDVGQRTSYDQGSPFYSIHVRHNGKRSMYSVGSLDQTEPSWWPVYGKALARLAIAGTHPIKQDATNGEFRGYVIGEWGKTPWR